MVGDFYNDKWQRYFTPPLQQQIHTEPDWSKLFQMPPTREEFEALRKEVKDMSELLKRAAIYDEKNNERQQEPHCEMEDKVATQSCMPKIFGIESDVFKAQ
jgi:hypothetical protein